MKNLKFQCSSKYEHKIKNYEKLFQSLSFFKPLTRKFTDACIDAIALEKKSGGGGAMYKPKYRIYIRIFFRDHFIMILT